MDFLAAFMSFLASASNASTHCSCNNRSLLSFFLRSDTIGAPSNKGKVTD